MPSNLAYLSRSQWRCAFLDGFLEDFEGHVYHPWKHSEWDGTDLIDN